MSYYKKITINDAYPNCYAGDGIFTDLQKLGIPWETENIASSLDVLYANHSGEKLAGKLIVKKMTDCKPLEDVDREIIALSIAIMYKTQWERRYKVLSAEYSPISNYDMVESETENKTLDTLSEQTNARTETGTRTYSDVGTVNNSGTTETNASVYGFNSSSDVNSDKASGNQTNIETRNLTRTETPNITDRNTSNTDSTEKETGTRTLTRRGNIGVTTSQQLLQSEIDLWKWSFFEEVFSDIDNIIALSIY